MENTDERGWRFAPYGWAAMRPSLDPELDGLTERVICAGFATRIRGNHLKGQPASRRTADDFGTPRLQWRRVIR
jgi:hypothetical protein